MQALSVTLVQTDLAWLNPSQNRLWLSERLQSVSGTDVVVLPEMFTTGFTMTPADAAESAEGPTLQWLQDQARRLQCAITGSVAVASEGRFFNRLYWVTPDGAVQRYDKRHLFRMAGEHDQYEAGSAPLVVQWRGWAVCPLVCYDLRFPVWSRRREQLDYDVLLYVANWPQERRHAWRTLLRARAIENLSYCIGVNRVGADGVGRTYVGDSAVVDFRGETCVDLAGQDALATVTLDGVALRTFRHEFPAHLDADRFALV